MIAMLGTQANDPADVAEVCRSNPLKEVVPLPWVHDVDGLKANMVANKTRPNKVVPCTPNKVEEPGCESIGFYDRLEDDAFGTMADALRYGTPVLNQIMETPCQHGFYGRVLSFRWSQGATVLLQCESIMELFPFEPISAKLYASLTVPVNMRNNEAFAEKTGVQDEEIAVMTVSDCVPGLLTFFSFLKLFSGKDFIFSAVPSTFVGPTPMLWRYNRAYRMRYDARILR